jgi:thiosulfate reductase cytochrome b subunit
MEPHDLDEAIERWMRERAAPAAPAGFTAAVLDRVREQRWQSERYWDFAFNAAVMLGLVLIVAGILGLVFRTGLAVVARDAVLLFATGLTTVADQVAPHLPMYVGGFILTASALGIWWWAENA